LEKNEHMMNFVGELKDKKQISKKKRKKISRSNTKAEEVKSSFGLNDSEIENIFDILEKEWGV